MTLLELRKRVGRRALPALVICAAFLLTRGLALATAQLAATQARPGFAAAWVERSSDLHLGPRPGPWVEPLLRWDALFYVTLARTGYPPPRVETVYHANFFPLYPLVVRAAQGLVGDTFAAALLVSNLCALGAALLLARLAAAAPGARLHDGTRAALLFLCFPGAHFLSLPYSESLCALWLAAGLLALQRGRPWLAGLCGGVASGARSLGLAVAAALVARAWQERRTPRAALGSLGAALLACSGALVYSAFCWSRYGDALYWVHSQRAFGRHFRLLGPVAGLFAFDADPSIYLVTLACLAALALLWRRMPLPDKAAAWFVPLLPLSTGTMKAMIRYQTLALPLFTWAPRLLRGRRFFWALAASLPLMLLETALYTLGRPHN